MILLTHKNCLDGFSCKTLIRYFKEYSAETSIFDFGHSELDTLIPLLKANAAKDEKIYIIDINYKDINAVLELKKEYPNLVYLDHHKYDDKFYGGVIAADLSSLDKAVVRVNERGLAWLYCPKENVKSGGLLFYDFAKINKLLKEISPDEEERLKNFLQLASDYDTWLWKEQNNLDSKKLAEIYYNISETTFAEHLYLYLTGEKELFNEFYNDYYEMMADKKEEKYKHLSNNCKIHKDIEGNNYIWFQFERAESEIMNRLLADERYKKVDYVVCYSYSAKSLSFRSKKGFDVSRIAKKYGGGGHAEAAGCNIPEHFIENFKL